MPAEYDLNEIADALCDRFQGRTMYQVGGQNVPLNAYSEIPGAPPVPALVIELDSVDWDITMARGADSFDFVVRVLLQGADSEGGQRILRAALSTGGVGTRLKDALDEDKTLGGLVSYAEISGTRRIGTVPYAGAEYVGAEIVIEVVAQ